MKYFKNTELATIYHVSEKSVRNWIEATQNGKLGLELHKENDRYYVANTTKNLDIIQGMVEERKKFTNGRAHKTVKPKVEFYKLFNESQILDIFKNIDIHHEIPQQYSYFDGGAQYWDGYAHKLAAEPGLNSINSAIKLLDLNSDYIIDQLSTSQRLNVIDLGVGNCLPVKKFIGYLSGKNLLNRYVGLDLSGDILKIAKSNMTEWFGDTIRYEDHIRDITQQGFGDIITQESFARDKTSPMNVVLLLGGTFSAVRLPDHALRVINYSMGRDDILVYSKKLDSEASRRYFDFHVESDKSPLIKNHELVLDLLNIDSSLYTVEQAFDEDKKMRTIQIRLKVDLTIDFELSNEPKRLELRKGDALLLWRSWHQSALDIIHQFERTGFDLLHSSLTGNQEYVLAIFKIKSRS